MRRRSRRSNGGYFRDAPAADSETADVVGANGRVGGDEGQVLDPGLRDEQPVEWVAVVHGQGNDGGGVTGIDG